MAEFSQRNSPLQKPPPLYPPVYAGPACLHSHLTGIKMRPVCLKSVLRPPQFIARQHQNSSNVLEKVPETKGHPKAVPAQGRGRGEISDIRACGMMALLCSLGHTR